MRLAIEFFFPISFVEFCLLLLSPPADLPYTTYSSCVQPIFPLDSVYSNLSYSSKLNNTVCVYIYIHTHKYMHIYLCIHIYTPVSILITITN